MPDKQVSRIIKIAKYKFHWRRKAIYEFITGHIEGLTERIPETAQKHYSTTRMFAAMSRPEKSKIIQILEQIERRNRNNETRHDN